MAPILGLASGLYGEAVRRVPEMSALEDHGAGSGGVEGVRRRPKRSQRGRRPVPRAAGETVWFGSEQEAAGAPGPRFFAGIVFNRPIEQVLIYGVPSRLERLIQPGQRVRVPLGKGDRLSVGYCVRLDLQPPEDLDPDRIKQVVEVLDPQPLIDGKMLELTRWLADYYACTWGQALDAVVPAGVKKHAGTRVGNFLIVPEETREAMRSQTILPPPTPKQAAVLDVLCHSNETLTAADVCRLAKCTNVPIQSLRQRGLVRAVRKRLPVGLMRPTATVHRAEAADAFDPAGANAVAGGKARLSTHATSVPRLILTGEQTAALARITTSISSGRFAPCLIHGVTSSGKTEVYLAAIEQVVARGREAIVLVPEISLTPQTIERFSQRFPRVAVLHSHLSDADRHRYWQSIAAGEVQVVVGVRSAIFAPARRLGLIVIDEEHEGTFKQETTPRYHARDVAVKRAQMEGIPVLLGSATPSLETWHNAKRGRYSHVAMPTRVGGRPMPEVGIIDLRHEKDATGGLSEPLRRAITHAIEDGGQVILLLNRRGFNTFVLCPRCGNVVKCRACDVAATYHRERNILICHTCSEERACPAGCPSCKAPKLYYGGIGTERLEREIHSSFPGIVARRMDSDTMRRPGSHEPRAGCVQGWRGQDPARDADDRQGTGFSERDPGGGGECRHRAAPS